MKSYDNEAVEPPKKRKTCRRYNDLGHAHYLTFSCFRRQRGRVGHAHRYIRPREIKVGTAHPTKLT